MKVLDINSNFLAVEEKFSNYENSKIAVISVPFEKTVSYGKGTESGPEEILNASHYVEFYDEELNKELIFDKGIATLEPLAFNNLSIEDSMDLIYKNVKHVLDENKFPVVLGGEHSISNPVIKAVHEKYNDISVLQFDAHSDLRESYEGSKYSHASVMARAAEFTKNIVQVGIRAQCKEEAEYIKQHNIKTFYAREIRLGKYQNLFDEILNSLNENVYITFDVDGFDPSFMPATGTPEPGGLFWDETMNLLRLIGEKKNIVGFDVVELAPNENSESSNFVAAKLVYKILNYAFINK